MIRKLLPSLWRDHLLFLCTYSSQVWRAATRVLGFTAPPINWDGLLHWLSTFTLNHVHLAAVLQIWHGYIYSIWQEHNARFHNGLTKPHWMLSREVIKQAKDKSTVMRSCGSDLGSSLVALWSSVLRMQTLLRCTSPTSSLVFHTM